MTKESSYFVRRGDPTRLDQGSLRVKRELKKVVEKGAKDKDKELKTPSGQRRHLVNRVS